MKQVILLLSLLSLVFCQPCAQLSHCSDCITNSSCIYCAGTSSGVCQDASTTCNALIYASNVSSSGGKCPTYCSDAANCGVCNGATFSAIGCVWCNFSTSGLQTCIANSTCPFVGSNITSTNCPATCQVAPAPNTSFTGSYCKLPANQMIPIQSGSFTSCNSALGIGAPEPGNSTANCSDACTVQYANLPKACLDLVNQYQCNALCPTCDSGFGLAYYSRYLPCQSVCDNIITTCNKALTGSCQFQKSDLSCSSAANCTNYAADVANSPVSACATPSTTSSTAAASSSTTTGGGGSTSTTTGGGTTATTQNPSTSKGASTSSSTTAGTTAKSSTGASTTPAPTPNFVASSTSDSSRILFVFGLLIFIFFN